MNAPIALITGGSRGLGRSGAEHLARQNTDLIITYKGSKAEAEKVVAYAQSQGRKAAALQLDVANSASFKAFADEVKKVLQSWGRTHFDFLVNNAGTALYATIEQTTEAQFDEAFNVHLKAPYFLTKALLPLIADGGRIINISSGLARFSVPGMSAYAAMKGAIEVLTRYLAKELAPRGITVNTVAPGAIATDFSGGAVRDNPEMNRFVSSVTALGRAGVPDDIGPMVASLLSDANRWVTGQRIEASGGMFL